jgi:hypothetical protein
MNTNEDVWGRRISTRTGCREIQLEVEQARVETLQSQTRAACAESIRRRKTLVYEMRGTHHLALRKDHPVNLTLMRSNRRGLFLVVNGERITRVVGTKR